MNLHHVLDVLSLIAAFGIVIWLFVQFHDDHK